MPRKTNSKTNANNEEKPTRSRTTKRPSTKRTNEQDQQAGGQVNQVNDHERAFDHREREYGEVF